MKIGVIEYRKEPSGTAKELINAVLAKGHEPVYLKTHLLDAVLSETSIKVYHKGQLVDMDGALLRNLGLFMNLDTFLKRLGVLEALATMILVVNHPTATLTARDKFRCLLRLKLSNLPVPETLVTENPFTAMRFVSEKNIVVYKPLTGSLGLGSTIVGDSDLAFYITRGLKNIGLPSYYQAFLEKPGYDYRVFVVGDEVIGAMKRVSKSWKTNIAQGAQGVPVKESEEPEVFSLALKAARTIGLDYAGVDIAYDMKTAKHYILEVNAFPHWEGLRRATGVNPPEIVVDYLISKIKR
ncbi:MAG: RimK family alpha-L-glutamate ligase [Desulfurococcaceae archaeon]